MESTAVSQVPIVFISFSAKDEALASAIHSFLNASGIKALKAPDDISPGTDWAAAIVSMIERCTHMVLIWTTNSRASPEVSKELTLAMQCGATIIPFRVQNIAPEGAWRYHLSHVQWLEAHRMPEAKALEDLASQIKSATRGVGLSRSNSTAASSTSPVIDRPIPQSVSVTSTPAWTSARRLFFGMACLTLFVLGAIYFLAGNSNTADPIGQATPEPAFAPSFDCSKASNQQERMVCSDRELSRLDVELRAAYSRARNATTNRSQLKQEQSAWIARELRGCSDKACLLDAYNERISQLARYASRSPDR